MHKTEGEACIFKCVLFGPRGLKNKAKIEECAVSPRRERGVGCGGMGFVVGGGRAAAGSLCLLGCCLVTLLVWLHGCALLALLALLARACMGAGLLFLAACLVCFLGCLPVCFSCLLACSFAFVLCLFLTCSLAFCPAIFCVYIH